VRDFADRQVFAVAGEIEPASGPPRSFDRVVQERRALDPA